RIRAPLVFFAAEKDAWVELRDVQEVFAAAASERKHLRVLEDGMHRLYENPEVAKLALKGAVEYAVRYLSAPKQIIDVGEPDLKEIGKRIRREKERNRLLHSVTRDQEREFWKSYLEKYAFIINVHDYWNLLDFMHRVLGEPKPQEKILDAGCGIGNYGSFLLMKALYRAGQQLFPKSVASLFSYVGVDFVEEAIAQAKQTHESLKKEFAAGAGPADTSYFLADLEGPLPFAARSFDQVCFNLVVSYLQEPGGAVAELGRVLKPGGRIAITSLKPFADLSEVYRNFVEVAETDREVEEARRLLSNAGQVMAKEAEGIYRFFSEEELTDLLRAAGISEVETYRSFGNQANVAVGIKG
ncbi:MAG TPA: class I SAM-dependent methyltransferase, partial [Candidatus Binatia bacterium]